MGTPNIKLRISDDANAALKRVVGLFPEWSLAQLAQKLITESCRAILGEGPIQPPTIKYVRGQIAPDPPHFESIDSEALTPREISYVREALYGRALQPLRLAEEPEVPPPRKQRAVR